MITVTVPRLVGADDISFGKGSLVYTDANGVIHTIPQVNASQIPLLGQNGYVEDLLGTTGNLLNYAVNNLDAAGTVVFDGIGGVGFLKADAGGNITAGNAIVAGDLNAGIMPAGIDATKIGAGNVTNAVYDYLKNVTSDIQNQINTIIAGAAVQAPFALLQNRQAQNTGGGTATAGSWLIYPFNTEQEDANNFVNSTALPAFSLGIGTYRFEAFIPIISTCVRRQIRLYNVTDGSVAILGESGIGGNNVTSNDKSILIGTVIIGGTKQFRLEYYVEITQTTQGFGQPANIDTEIYGQLKIWKIA